MSALTIDNLPALREALRDALVDMGYRVSAEQSTENDTVTDATFDHMAEIVRDMFFIEAVANRFCGNIYDYGNETPPAGVPTDDNGDPLTVKAVIQKLFAETAAKLSSETNFTLAQNKFKDNTDIIYVPRDYVVGSNTNLSSCFQNCISLLKCPYNVDALPAVDLEATEAVTRTDHNSSLSSTVTRTYNRPRKYNPASYADVPAANKTTAVTNMSNMFNACSSLSGVIRLDCTAATNLGSIAGLTNIGTLIFDNMRTDTTVTLGQLVPSGKTKTILGLHINLQIGRAKQWSIFGNSQNVTHIEFTSASHIMLETYKRSGLYTYVPNLGWTAGVSFDADTLMQLVEMLYDWQNDPDDQGGAVGYTHASKTLYERCKYYDLASNKSGIDSRNASVNTSGYASTNDDFTTTISAKGLCLNLKQANLQTLADAGMLDTAYALAVQKGWRLTEADVTIGNTTYQGSDNRTLTGDSGDFAV